ncbi:MAG: GWxTD domain-containing protein [Thermoanaerobaculia bacterium]
MTGTSFLGLLPVFLLAAAFAAAQPGEAPHASMPDLFQQGKTAFKLANYKLSLETFEKLDVLSLSASERDRAELEPVIAFYRGANLAALGEEDAAKKEFKKYLGFSPNARPDPSMYPRPVVVALEKARDELARESTGGRGPGYQERGIALEYMQFRQTQEGTPLPIDENWASGPVRYLMTDAEKTAWDRITGPVERAAFVSAFWQNRDPNPSTPENEFRIEFERRAAFADKRFRAGETAGMRTDRGLVFVLLGPPSYTRLFGLTRQDDLNLSVRTASRSEAVLQPNGQIIMRTVPAEGIGAQPGGGQKEVWYYKRDRLPASVKYAEVPFEFLSKRSYGVSVLQREPIVLKTLEQAGRETVVSPN